MNRLKRILPVMLVGTLAVGCASQSDDTERRIDALLARMTLDEKIGQMNQISATSLERMEQLTAAGAVGSILNLTDTARVNRLQRIAVEESRLGIPLLIARDVIHGFRTIFPIPLGQAATFDPELVEAGARIAAREASSVGIRWTFSPMLDVSRDPRWGRIAESSGEDVLLNAVMGAAMVRGYQGDDPADPTSIAACAKHFAGYGAAEGGRDYNSTHLTERQLRTTYLPPFEAAARAGALTFMTSFNDNDGVPSTANRFLLKQMLRNEWGFRGFVVTDWASAAEMVTHGFAGDLAEAARLSANAGVDMDMMGNAFSRHLKQLVEQGAVPEARIDDAVRNILRVKLRLGLFENPYVDPARAPQELYAPEHLAAAKRAALESAILLRNEHGTLPLSPRGTLLVCGPMADAPHDQLGTWSFDGEEAAAVTPLAALRNLYGDRVRIRYEAGLTYSRDRRTDRLAAVTAAARQADAVVVFAGEEAILSGEAHSLSNLDLQGAQSELIAAAKRGGKPVVLVVLAGRPLTIGREAAMCDAVLYAFHPGTMGGEALAELLFGDAVPSGKTPVTFPREVGQVPTYYAHNNTGRPASGSETLLDDIPLKAGQTSLGCTSFYLDSGFGPLWPFGYGLSYTTFAYSEPAVDAAVYAVDGTIQASCTLTNTGDRTGTEVVQLYVRDLVGSTTRPVRELKAFRRVTLDAGESREVLFELPVAELACWDIDMRYRVEPGRFRLWIAGDSDSGVPVEFEVE